MIPSILPTYSRAPLAFEAGAGAWLTATDGRRFLDFGAGIAVNALGHAHPVLVETLQRHAMKPWHLSNLYEIPEQTALANRLVEESRHGVLHQFWHRGLRTRSEDGAEILVGD